MLALRLPTELESRLSALAARTGRTKSFYAREAINHYIDELEEQYWADSVVQRWEKSDKQTIPASEFKAEFNL
ncbi:MAG: TraY domain-containing protein [Coriobacteriales bacterium]|jgi:RHH-type rel operon transcriptional repressor/antitoxin RelB|nr:TraY domain-containing protein [Coriobacteriales bacterium]